MPSNAKVGKTLMRTLKWEEYQDGSWNCNEYHEQCYGQCSIGHMITVEKFHIASIVQPVVTFNSCTDVKIIKSTETLKNFAYDKRKNVAKESIIDVRMSQFSRNCLNIKRNGLHMYTMHHTLRSCSSVRH